MLIVQGLDEFDDLGAQVTDRLGKRTFQPPPDPSPGTSSGRFVFSAPARTRYVAPAAPESAGNETPATATPSAGRKLTFALEPITTAQGKATYTPPAKAKIVKVTKEGRVVAKEPVPASRQLLTMAARLPGGNRLPTEAEVKEWIATARAEEAAAAQTAASSSGGGGSPTVEPTPEATLPELTPDAPAYMLKVVEPGLSTAAKVGIGAAAMAAVAGVLWLGLRRRGGSVGGLEALQTSHRTVRAKGGKYEEGTVYHEGRAFTAGGSVVTKDYIVAYVDGRGNVTTWAGKPLGTYKVTARWKAYAPGAYTSHGVEQVRAYIGKRFWTGRVYDNGNIVRLRPVKG